MAVVIPLNRFMGPADDTVTTNKHYSILNTRTGREIACCTSSRRASELGKTERPVWDVGVRLLVALGALCRKSGRKMGAMRVGAHAS